MGSVDLGAETSQASVFSPSPALCEPIRLLFLRRHPRTIRITPAAGLFANGDAPNGCWRGVTDPFLMDKSTAFGHCLDKNLAASAAVWEYR